MIAQASIAAPACPLFVRRIPHRFAREHLVLGLAPPESPEEGQLSSGPTVQHHVMATAGSTPQNIIHNALLCWTGTADTPLLTQEHDAELLARLIDASYAGADQSASSTAESPIATILVDSTQDARGAGGPTSARDAWLSAADDANLLSTANKEPLVRLVDGLLLEALTRGASDLHVQPLGHVTLVRLRLDGVLITVRELPPALAQAIVSRVKVIARLDVAERRAPQDGRATVVVAHANARRTIDLRVATIPSTFGERMVVRLLDTQRGSTQATLAALWMPDAVLSRYTDHASRSSGIVLVTGPTGSGKTTTLYATLRWLASGAQAVIVQAGSAGHDAGCGLNILTIEDPVEYDLSALAGPAAGVKGPRVLAISQMQTDAKKNVTFASGLRHILRQDPDVIMVGEVRDSETARTAVQASLTGHLVFSTLHTADAPSSIARLTDLGTEPFLVAPSLSCVLAQRLVRLSHQACDARGCDQCGHTGFRGRRAIFELLCVDNTLRGLIASAADVNQLRVAAVAGGMVSLHQAGLRLVDQGVTTLPEVLRVTAGVDK